MERRITRREAAEILGTSYSNVRRLEREGQLTSSLDAHGTMRFRRVDVEALARRRELSINTKGELASRVFRMFKRNMTFADVVIESEQEPDTIRALWRCYTYGFDGASSALRDDEPQMKPNRSAAPLN